MLFWVSSIYLWFSCCKGIWQRQAQQTCNRDRADSYNEQARNYWLQTEATAKNGEFKVWLSLHQTNSKESVFFGFLKELSMQSFSSLGTLMPIFFFKHNSSDRIWFTTGFRQMWLQLNFTKLKADIWQWDQDYHWCMSWPFGVDSLWWMPY